MVPFLSMMFMELVAMPGLDLLKLHGLGYYAYAYWCARVLGRHDSAALHSMRIRSTVVKGAMQETNLSLPVSHLTPARRAEGTEVSVSAVNVYGNSSNLHRLLPSCRGG